MDNHTIILVTDPRQQYISEFLPGRSGDRLTEGKEKPHQPDPVKVAKWIRNAGCVVLPTPVSKLDRSPHIKEILKENLIILKEEDVVRNPTVFGGKFDAGWQEFLNRNEIAYVDFMEEETVAMANAVITAEATIAELLKHCSYSIQGEKYIVTGYGRCGKAVADRLAALGGHVTVLARSVRDRKAAKKDGRDAADFAYGPEEAYGTRAIINTVPATVIGEHMIREMHRDTIILDIASKPGGVDLSAAEKYRIPVIQALGLPGIYTTKSSAKIFAESIIRHTLPKEGMKEDRSWIFQIII